MSEKEAWPESRDPNIFWSNCSNAVKAMDFKFDKPVPRESPDMTPYRISEKRVVAIVM